MWNYITQDLKANQTNTKGKFILFFFRLNQFLLNGGIAIKLISIPLLIIYRISIEWILGVELPPRVNAGKNLRVFHGQAIVINSDVILGYNVTIRHSTTIGNKYENGKCPKIGNFVDIGSNTVILGDITIGDNVVIGAGSVVIKNLEANSIYAGNPIKLLRKLDTV